MKFYGKEIPPDIEIPELDADTIQELDALHQRCLAEQREWEEFRKLYPPTATNYSNRPVRQLGINFEAFRQLPPRVRAIMLYVQREHVTP
ncbi:hypothetical protein ACLB1G_08995 [Oxalobacteraceae bacterium A2-2]